MYSKTTSKIVENTLISYLDKHIAALKKGERFELFSASTGINYCNLVHYISAPEEKYYSRRLSMRISQIINNNLSQMYYQITQHYCGYVSKNQQKKLITWANKLIQMNFSFDLFKMLVQCDARISKAAKTQLKVYLKQRIDAAKNKNNNGVVVYPTKQPYEELDQVGYWCLLNVLKAKDFQEFLGNSEAFDFYCEYTKFDFNKFDVSWLLNLYPHTLEQIAKNEKVKGCVRVAIADALNDGEIALSDSQRLQSILVKHFARLVSTNYHYLIIIFSKKRLTLSHSNPLADGAVVIAGKVHSGGHIEHVRQHGYLALVVALKLLLVLGARWMECFPLTDLAGNLHLLLIHNLRFL